MRPDNTGIGIASEQVVEKSQVRRGFEHPTLALETALQVLQEIVMPAVGFGHRLLQQPAPVGGDVIHVPELLAHEVRRKQVDAFLGQARTNGVDGPEPGGESLGD